jgi:hypothetical protein
MEKIPSNLSKNYKKNVGKRLLIFWDGVRHHTGENMQKFLAKQNEGLAKSEWKIIPLLQKYAERSMRV